MYTIYIYVDIDRSRYKRPWLVFFFVVIFGSRHLAVAALGGQEIIILLHVGIYYATHYPPPYGKRDVSFVIRTCTISFYNIDTYSRCLFCIIYIY